MGVGFGLACTGISFFIICGNAPRRILARQMEGSHRLPGNQSPQTLQVYRGGTQHALLVEAQQEADECRGVEAGASGDVQAAAGSRGEVQACESVSIKLPSPAGHDVW